MLGNTHSRCPLIDSIDLSIRRDSLLNGTLCGFFIFINSAGMFHMLLSISISDHLARTASPGRTHVRSCHSISSLVSKRTDALFSAARKRGSSDGGEGRHILLFRLTETLAQIICGVKFNQLFCSRPTEDFIQPGNEPSQSFQYSSLFKLDQDLVLRAWDGSH